MKKYIITAILEVHGTPSRPYGYRLELDGTMYTPAVIMKEPRDFSDKVGKEVTALKLCQTPFVGDLIYKR